jgi:hypothetical protein
MLTGPVRADFKGGFGVVQVPAHQCQRMAAQVITETHFAQHHRRAFYRGVHRSQQDRRAACFHDSQRIANQFLANAEHRIVQIGMHVAEEDTAVQRIFCFSNPHPGRKGLFGAGYATANQHQVAARVNAAATQKGNWRAFDHLVAGQHTGGHVAELQQRDRAVPAIFIFTGHQTIRK